MIGAPVCRIIRRLRNPLQIAAGLALGLSFVAPPRALALGVPVGGTPVAVVEAAAPPPPASTDGADGPEADAEDEAALDQPLLDDGDDGDDGDDAAGASTAPAPVLLALPALPDLSVLLAEPVRGVASSGFGWRDDPIRHRRRRFHRGTDFRAPHGTPVYAAGDGEVVFACRRRGYGRSIDVRHGGGLLTRYAHLSRVEVDRGQSVPANTVIGRVGSTGRSTGPHLHFEVRVLGHAVDPDLAVRIGELQRLDAAPEAAELAAVALRAEGERDPGRTLTDGPRRGDQAPAHHGGKASDRRRGARHHRPRVS